VLALPLSCEGAVLYQSRMIKSKTIQHGFFNNLSRIDPLYLFRLRLIDQKARETLSGTNRISAGKRQGEKKP
jgi:hypothetical protein